MKRMDPCDQALAFARQNRDLFLRRLAGLLRFPTVSADFPNRVADFRACADWLLSELRQVGFQRAGLLMEDGLVSTDPGGTGADWSSPAVVYAEWIGAPGAPTLLIYGHYDVVPVEPVDAWAHPPFEPYVDNERVYARGASDDKGQLFAILCAAQAWLATGGPPVNLKVLIEGEEEDLSPHLEALLIAQRELLRCDGIIVADMGGLAPEVPLVEYGTRGNCSLEVQVDGPALDLHSGTYGGAVDNPLNVLVRLLADLQDGESRRVLIPGFYETVRDLSPRDRAFLDAVPIPDEIGLAISGAPALGGEPGFPLKERVSWRPDFEVHGIRGGYSGPGIKTVIPAQAAAKISFRLVPDQAPAEIYQQVVDYLKRLAPPTVRLHFTPLGMAEAVSIDVDSPIFAAANAAYRQVWGAPPVYVRGGGSLPVATLFQRYIHPNLLLTGFGLPGDGEHAPNESFSLQQFYRGIDMMVCLLGCYPMHARPEGKQPGQQPG